MSSTDTAVADDAEVAQPEVVDDVRDAVRQARELIPVGPSGLAPLNFAQQVDYAKTMCLGKVSIPQHLRNQPADCLAIVDISTRTGLSPFMLANHSYVQSGRLCFESQVFHALAQASRLLKGDFQVEWEGEGENLVCTVTGYLRGDPEAKVLHSEPLGKLHPGHVTKDGKRFVKGSQEWDRKPRKQMFFDTSRDWVRMYCPRATLGIPTVDEMQDHFGPDNAKDVTSLADRLATVDRSEGHRDGHVAAELANIASDQPQEILPAQGEEAVKSKKAEKTEPSRRLRGRAARRAEQTEPAHTETLVNPKHLPTDAHVKAVADKAEAAAKKVEPKVIPDPKNAAEYESFALAWIEKANDGDDALARWEGEREMREACIVPIKTRNGLYNRLAVKFEWE